MKRALALEVSDGVSVAKGRISAVVVGALLVGALVPELQLPRYGADSFTASVPVIGGLLSDARLSYLLIISALGVIAVTLMLNTANSATGPARFASQLSIWAPYAIAWTMAAGFGGYVGASPAAWISLLMVLAVSALPMLGTARQQLESAAYLATRGVVIASLGVGIWSPSRAFAPYEVWPGGWRVGVDRLQGVLPHPNTAAWVAVVAIALELLGPRRGVSRIGALVAGLALLVQTGSRTATLALLAGLAVAVSARWIERSRNHRSIVVALGPIVLALPVVVAFGVGLSVNAFNGRAETWELAYRSFLANPLLGSGPGAFVDPGSGIESVAYAHNQILQTAAELGMVGLIGLLAHVILLIRYSRGCENRPLAACLIAMWLVMFVAENLIRFASLVFVPQVLLFQLTLFVARGQEVRPVIRSAGSHIRTRAG